MDLAMDLVEDLGQDQFLGPNVCPVVGCFLSVNLSQFLNGFLKVNHNLVLVQFSSLVPGWAPGCT